MLVIDQLINGNGVSGGRNREVVIGPGTKEGEKRQKHCFRNWKTPSQNTIAVLFSYIDAR